MPIDKQRLLEKGRNVLWDDRHWLWKWTLSVLALVVLFQYGRVAGGGTYPPLWAFLIDPERHAGRSVWIPLAEVLETGPDGYVILEYGLEQKLRVASPPPPELRVGDWIEADALLNADRTLTVGPGRILIKPHYLPARGGMTAVSLVALAWLTLRVRRRYRWGGISPAPFVRRPDAGERADA